MICHRCKRLELALLLNQSTSYIRDAVECLMSLTEDLVTCHGCEGLGQEDAGSLGNPECIVCDGDGEIDWQAPFVDHLRTSIRLNLEASKLLQQEEGWGRERIYDFLEITLSSGYALSDARRGLERLPEKDTDARLLMVRRINTGAGILNLVRKAVREELPDGDPRK